ncbi:hypothetical protein [Rothia amarae]|uniref:hypothetical protein n=1 Tax=Rothia amarae TaxID=169480 RepID=UPI0031D5A63E
MSWSKSITDGRLSYEIWGKLFEILTEDQQTQVRNNGGNIHKLNIPYRPISTEWVNDNKNSRIAVFFIGSYENTSHSAHYVFYFTNQGGYINLHPKATADNPHQGFTLKESSNFESVKEVVEAHNSKKNQLISEVQKLIDSSASLELSL